MGPSTWISTRCIWILVISRYQYQRCAQTVRNSSGRIWRCRRASPESLRDRSGTLDPLHQTYNQGNHPILPTLQQWDYLSSNHSELLTSTRVFYYWCWYWGPSSLSLFHSLFWTQGGSHRNKGSGGSTSGLEPPSCSHSMIAYHSYLASLYPWHFSYCNRSTRFARCSMAIGSFTYRMNWSSRCKYAACSQVRWVLNGCLGYRPGAGGTNWRDSLCRPFQSVLVRIQRGCILFPCFWSFRRQELSTAWPELVRYMLVTSYGLAPLSSAFAGTSSACFVSFSTFNFGYFKILI